ncbi:unnamed protein product [Phytophthora lilii]|uniref:Unnamed protein product n=1 Tax=Phytophthora lilii TaxID=2077276 RepID=A0A9W6TML2_9STRA|nr:unnamed protein product [Phytophthora lilii]
METTSKSSVAFIMNSSSENVHVNDQEATTKEMPVPASSRSRRTRSPANDEKRKTRECKANGCENYIINKGLCFRHGGGKKCSAGGCRSSAKNAGLCWRHGMMVLLVCLTALKWKAHVRLMVKVAGLSVKWRVASGEASREASAGPMEEAPSARTTTAPKLQCQTACAGHTEAGNAVCSKAARRLRTSATTTTALSTPACEHKTARLVEVMATSES